MNISNFVLLPVFLLIISVAVNGADNLYEPVDQVSTSQLRPVLIEDNSETDFGDGELQEYLTQFCKMNMSKEELKKAYEKDPKLQDALRRLGKSIDFAIASCDEKNRDIIIRDGRSGSDDDGKSTIEKSFR